MASKLNRTENAGTGYNGIDLTLPEYNEIKNYTNLPKLPKESKSISVSDTYGFQDFSRVVEFNVPPNFNIERYYRDSSLTEDMEVMDRIMDKVRGEWMILDSTKYKRIKWEVGET